MFLFTSLKTQQKKMALTIDKNMNETFCHGLDVPRKTDKDLILIVKN
jgi:hypothetical protein